MASAFFFACWYLSLVPTEERILLGLLAMIPNPESVRQHPAAWDPIDHSLAYERLPLAEPQFLVQSCGWRAGTQSSALGNQFRRSYSVCTKDLEVRDNGESTSPNCVAPDLETKAQSFWAEQQKGRKSGANNKACSLKEVLAF